MAFSRSLAALVLLSLLLLHLTEADQFLMGTSEAPAPLPSQKIDCGKACKDRCQSSKRPNLCQRSCGSCCNKCNCVPPGTYGNLNVCPCYANLMTEKNGKKYHKCP